MGGAYWIGLLCIASMTIKSAISARTVGARDRVVQNGIGEAHVFLLTCAPWAEPNKSVDYENAQLERYSA